MPYIGRSEKFGVRNRFYYTQASGGATSISGNDDAGKGLSFTDGAYVDVALNGVTLVAGTDYNTTTANTIAGLSALSAGDIIEILVYDVFNVADTVSATSGGTFTGGVTMGGTLAVTGASTLSSTLAVTGKITSTAGITFGSDTAAANVLSDYEEGTFTLQMFDASSGGNASSTTGSGYYTKIGSQVSITVGAVNNVSTSGLTGGNAVYLSLPFTASNPSGRSAGSVIFHGVDYTDSTTQANLTVSAGAARGQLRVSGNGRADGTIKVEDFNGSSDDIVFLALSYTTDA
jgi:filamentous hemagglutinin